MASDTYLDHLGRSVSTCPHEDHGQGRGDAEGREKHVFRFVFTQLFQKVYGKSAICFGQSIHDGESETMDLTSVSHKLGLQLTAFQAVNSDHWHSGSVSKQVYIKNSIPLGEPQSYFVFLILSEKNWSYVYNTILFCGGKAGELLSIHVSVSPEKVWTVHTQPLT